MPYVITESFGEGQQLKKTVLYYGKGAVIEQKDVYDANDTLRYSIKMGYDEKGRLTSETNAIGQEAIYQYDEVGNRIYARDFSGKLETFYFFDYSNRLIKKELRGNDGENQVYAYSYDTKHNLISETDPYGNTETYVPDAFGHQVEIHLPKVKDREDEEAESSSYFKYDSAGNQTEKIDAEGNVTKTEHSAYGKPTFITHPDGAKESFTYYLNGNLKTHTNTNGTITSYKYDYLNRIIKKKILNAEEFFEYTGQYLTRKIDAEGNETTFTYDLAGRKKSEEFCGEKIFYSYDELGRAYKTEKGDLVTVIKYDLLNRKIEKRNETKDQKVLKKIQYEYDVSGNQKTIIRFINGKEEREEFVYDFLNRLIEKKDALGAIETYLYGSHTHQKIHTDPQDLQTVESYNEQNRVVSIEKIKNQKTVDFEKRYYDKTGKKTLQVNTIYSPNRDTRQVRTSWQYNSRGFLTALIEAEGTLNSKTTRYTYTPTGSLKTVSKPNGVTLTYGYNDYGHLTSLKSSDGTVNHEMEYNLLGQLQRSNDFTRQTDPCGRILKEVFSSQLEIENTYDESGRRKSCVIPSADCLITYEYDPMYLKTVTRKRLDETPLYTHSYSKYDLSGNLLEEKLISSDLTVTFGIDALSRTTSVHSPQFSQKILEFDAVGNIKAMCFGEDVINYSYDDLYQLTSESGLFAHDYTYDSLSNRTEKDDEIYEINELNQVDSHFEYTHSS